MNFIYLGIFIIFTGIHLFGSYKQNNILRRVTKPIILLSLIGFYLETTIEPSWFVIVALLLSWLGDLLLIPDGDGWFIAGGISFLISHIFFILSYIEIADCFNNFWYTYVIFAVMYLIIVVLVLTKIKPHLKKKIFYPTILYFLVNGSMNCFAIFRFIGVQNIGTIVTVIGAVLFFISDSALFFVRFKKEQLLKTHFFVMLTYTIAEFLIVLGFLI